MAIWNQLKQSAQGMQTQLVAKKNDLKSGAFRDASMAMCALVAAADGSIDAVERQQRRGRSSSATTCCRTSRRTICGGGSRTT